MLNSNKTQIHRMGIGASDGSRKTLTAAEDRQVGLLAVYEVPVRYVINKILWPPS
jgi:hypothetical protein